MKQFFEEPKVCVEQFAVTDQTLFLSSPFEIDELTPYGVPAIVPKKS